MIAGAHDDHFDEDIFSDDTLVKLARLPEVKKLLSTVSKIDVNIAKPLLDEWVLGLWVRELDI